MASQLNEFMFTLYLTNKLLVNKLNNHSFNRFFSMISTMTAINWLTILMEVALLVFLPAELLHYWRRRSLKWPRIKEMLASISPIFPNILIGGFVLSMITTVYSAAAEVSPWEIPTTPITALFVFLLVDFMYYWDHRCSHRIRGLWALYHSVHHSSTQFDQTTSLRISLVDNFFSPWFYLPVILIGFDPLLVVACFGFVLAYQTWIHTETIGRLKWLDGWLNTPSNHRVHHGSQIKYHDKNYGAVLMIWDHLFGSYKGEEETPIYGITHPIDSANPWHVHFCEVSRLWRELVQMKSWCHRIGTLLMPPGWQPKRNL
jgi:sterol desaturase/sphingolipid hydroxylase (fatty acid hydroxylase superfamily)